MSPVRLRRLGADFVKLQDYVRRHARVRMVQSVGNPPESYQLEYRIRSLRMVDEELRTIDTHLVEINLPLNYPRTPPQCRMLSPVFHPNIAPHAICVGDHWSAGESLHSIVTRIGEMLAYQSYNTKSPLNGEAARWVDQNKHRLPLDPVSLIVEEEQSERATPAALPAGQGMAPTPGAPGQADFVPPPPKVAVETQPSSSASLSIGGKIQCPSCGTAYRWMAQLVGKRVRCKKCESEFEVPAA